MRLRSLLLVVVGAVGGMRLVGQAAATPSSYEQGRQAFAERRFGDAATLFRAAAAEPGAPADAGLREAKARIDGGDVPGAEAPLRAYLARETGLGPGAGVLAGAGEARYLLGFVLERENRPRESLEEFTRAAALERPKADDLRLVALDYVLLEDYADAIHWLERAIAMNPQKEEAWYDLGRAEMHEGRFVKAELDFHRAIALAPGHVKALDNLGLSLEAQNRTAEALGMYERAIAAGRAAPGRRSEQPLLNYGTLLNTENRAMEAVGPLREAVGLAAGSSRCHEELARAYVGTHQDAAARDEFVQAIALDGANPRLHFQLGQLYRRMGDTARAESELKRSAALYGTRSSAPGEGPVRR